MGTKLKYSIVFHPLTDEQTKQTNHILEDMLRACALDFKGGWRKYLYQAELAYNNSYQETVGIVPYECLYGRHCRSPLTWHEVGKKKVLEQDL